MPTSNDFRELSVGTNAVDASTAPSQVIGRDDLVQALWMQVRSGSTRLSAPPRIGKTWFLNLALAMRPEWAGPTLFNAAECRSLREFVWELTRHLHTRGFVPDVWEAEVREWYTRRPAVQSGERDTGGVEQSADDWEPVLFRTCAILVEKGAADCPVLMIDELPAFLETLVGEWAEDEAGRLLEALHRLRLQYPTLRMILSDAQGLQRVVERLHNQGFNGHPLDDLPPFELPPLSAPDARYLAGCLLLGEQVPCDDIHAVAQAVAEACNNVPPAIRNTVDWMARFASRPWTAERVASLPTTRAMDDAEDPLSDERLYPFGADDVVQVERPSRRVVASPTDRMPDRGFSTLFPFSLESLADDTTLNPRRADASRPEDETRSVVAGPLADRFPLNYLDPACRSLDWLDATLSPPHRKLVMDVRTALARCMPSGNPRHVLFAGPAGSGKSHTLAVLAKGFAKGLGLSGRQRKVIYLPVPDQSESPFDLLLACMQAEGGTGDRLRKRLDAVQPEERFDEVAAAFHERHGGQATFIAVENLGAAFRTWNKAALDSMRQFLEREPYVFLLGTAGPEPLDVSRLPVWMKERFQVYPMPALDSGAVGELLCALASTRGDAALAAALREPRRRPIVRAVHALSGGNCRFVASLDRCLSEKGLGGLEEPVAQTVRGELAPSYERRLNERAAQQYKILQALAEHQGRAVNVTELARYMFLSPQAVSRQLQELLRAGFLVRTQVGRETCYELHDPLIRFVLDLKHGRDSALPLLVRVVHRWCEVDRLYCFESEGYPFVEAFRFDGFVEVSSPTPAAPEAPAAFVALDPNANPRVEKQANARVTKCLELTDAALRDAGLEPQIVELVSRADKDFATVFHAAGMLSRGQNLAALEAVDHWLRTAAASSETTRDSHVMAHAVRVYALLALDRWVDTVAAADAVLRQDETETSQDSREPRATIAIDRGVALLKLGRFEDAALQFDRVVQQNDPGTFPEIVAAALVNRAVALDRLGRYAEAIAALDLVTEQFHRAVRAGHRESAATAQVAKAAILERLGQHDDALAACDAALRVQPSHSRALVMRAQCLCRKGAPDAVLRAVEAAMDSTRPGQSDRGLLAAGLIERMTGMESTVQLAAAIFGRDRRSLLHGLILWVRNRIAKPYADARQMQRRLHTLRPIFEDDPEAGLVMNVADVLARSARGDARAALDLPIELRRLLEVSKS